MRMYQSAIANCRRQNSGSLEQTAPAAEEIQIMAKAGQGAFGVVYVATWR